jgi:hypothetical protein
VASRDIQGVNGTISPAGTERTGPTRTETASSLFTLLPLLYTPRVGGTSA